MELLTSRSNPKIKTAALLGQDARRRRQQGAFLLEGARLCEDAALCGIPIQTVFVTAQALEKYAERLTPVLSCAAETYMISDAVAAALSDTKAPQGVFCVCKPIDKKISSYKIERSGAYVALENIQNPDNLGAISRTAEALGVTGMIVSGGCDIYNPKAQRAAMGALLRLPILQTDDLPALLRAAADDGLRTLASTPDAGATDIRRLATRRGVICVVGNEGAGVSEDVMRVCTDRVTIPMAGRAQSLNAASAAAILMWEVLYGS